MAAKPKITPMLQQYLEIKNAYPDTILFYRMGDFYEMFFEDAQTASRILGITLTSRSHKNDTHKIPMCGVPYHAAAGYLAKLVQAGKRVAICEQTEDPAQAKGIVRRQVVRVITPGLVTEDEVLDDKSNRYLASVVSRKEWGLAFLDLSTGEFFVTQCHDDSALVDELNRVLPSEILFAGGKDPEQATAKLAAILGPMADETCLTSRPDHHFQLEHARQTLQDHFNTINLAGFGCDHLTVGIRAAGALLNYLAETQKTDLSHIDTLRPLDLTDILMIDDSSRRNLELTQTIIGGQRNGSLLATLDCTTTPMGARFLKKALLFPLRDCAAINQRLDTVEHLYNTPDLRRTVTEYLTAVYDLERLNSRVVLGSANARDLLALKISTGQLPALVEALADCPGRLGEIGRQLDPLVDIHSLLESAIHPEPPVTLREGRLIRSGYNAELDELRAILKDGKGMIAALEAKERQQSGLAKLKIGFNKVFGYYFEVSRANLDKVPDYFIRKQTLVNAERFITPELKEFEQKVLGADEKRLALEYQLFCAVRSRIGRESSRILQTAAQIAELDFFTALGEIAIRNKYRRPTIDDGEEIRIREGRHPVIEQALPTGRFVPNDLTLNQTDQEVLLITGPNMAGKSTILRQTALIVLMAQMGSFVPADQAHIGVVDRIFTRVGAMDNLRRAQSTFMVEMNETANILHNATPRSLVVLDEIGRGTSTYDGLSIAWAVAEELANKEGRGVRTLFATHYHELTDLARVCRRVKNYNIAVREWNDTIVFLHKLLPGGTNRSYGIQVASLAGVPDHVIKRAKELLHNIENGELDHQGKPRIAGPMTAADDPAGPSQLELFVPTADPIGEKIRALDLDTMTPLDALQLLYTLRDGK